MSGPEPAAPVPGRGAASATSEIALHAWRQKRRWSVTADRLKQRIDRARNVSLALGVLGAILAVLASQFDADGPVARVLAVTAGTLVGLAPVVHRAASQDAVRAWTRARSVSEGLKSEVYAYLAGGSNYVGADRDRTLAGRIQAITADLGDLVAASAGVGADDRDLPGIDGIDDYLEHRVDEQVHEYYRPKAARYARRLARIQRVEATLGGVGVLLAVLVGTGGIVGAGAWIAVVSTIAATVSAHAGAARYDHQVVEFERTAARLEHLRATWRIQGLTPEELIDACEDAISVENQAWMARMVDPESESDENGQPPGG